MGSYDPYLIDQYLLNQLSLDETAAFENTIKQDVELANQVDEQRELIQSLQLTGKLETRTQIKAITKNWKAYVPELKETKTDGFETLIQTADEKIEQLIQLAHQFFIPYSVSYRNQPNQNRNEKEEAYYLFVRKDYEKALSLLAKLPNKNIEARLMSGNACMELQKYEKAYQIFKTIIKEKPLGFVNEAHWYACLAALCLNKTEQAIQHVQVIIEDTNSSKKLKSKATDLLNNLKRIN